jgi:peptidoglycan lytic transglycosylase
MAPADAGRLDAGGRAASCCNKKEPVVTATIRRVMTSVAILATQLVPAQFARLSAESQSGIASVYSTESGSGTASGQKLDPQALTAAHRTLPFGTKVKVTNKSNGRSVVVTINDRGPFVSGRVIDVTPAAARALGFSSLTQVTLNVGGNVDE